MSKTKAELLEEAKKLDPTISSKLTVKQLKKFIKEFVPAPTGSQNELYTGVVKPMNSAPSEESESGTYCKGILGSITGFGKSNNTLTIEELLKKLNGFESNVSEVKNIKLRFAANPKSNILARELKAKLRNVNKTIAEISKEIV